VHGKETPGAKGPAHVVPFVPSGKVQERLSTLALPAVTESVTFTSVRVSVPLLVTLKVSCVDPLLPLRSTASFEVFASFPLESFLTMSTFGEGAVTLLVTITFAVAFSPTVTTAEEPSWETLTFGSDELKTGLPHLNSGSTGVISESVTLVPTGRERSVLASPPAGNTSFSLRSTPPTEYVAVTSYCLALST